MEFDLRLRAIRPPDEPNANDPPPPPGTVGPPSALAGDAAGVELMAGEPVPPPPPIVSPAAWSGWPAEWGTSWQVGIQRLAAVAWTCIDRNASVLAAMPPYLVNAAPTLDSDWLRNPQPLTYGAWYDFAKSLFWDYQATGEAFVLATSYYASGWPSRFHVVPGWLVESELVGGIRRYKIGREDVTDDLCHIRYQGSVDDARGHGPIEAAGAHVTAASVLTQYATTLAAGGGIPPSVLSHEDVIGPEKAAGLKAQWIAARASGIGEPAVLEGGVTWTPTSVSPKDMALIELLTFNESRIAVMLGVPPFLVGLPSGGDSMTYANVSSVFNFHWRGSLLPMAAHVCANLSEWALPRDTKLEVNRDSYVQPEPLERAQTEATLAGIKDEQGNPALTVAEIREAERLDQGATAVGVGPLA